MSNDVDKIGKFILKQRKLIGLSQTDLAKMLNVSRTTVGYWEEGRAFPNNDNLTKLAKILGVTKEEILNGESAPPKIKDSKAIKITINKKKLIISIASILIILLGIFLISLIPRVYVLSLSSKNIEITDGFLIVKKDKVTFFIGNIELSNDKEIQDLEIYTMRDKSKGLVFACENCSTLKIILNDRKRNNVYFNMDEINKIIDNLYLNITYKDLSRDELKFSFERKFQLSTKEYEDSIPISEINYETDWNKIIAKIESKWQKADDGYIYSNSPYEIMFLDNNVCITNMENAETFMYNIYSDYLTYESEKENDGFVLQTKDNMNNKKVREFYRILTDALE